jgi:hypothetical protein
VTAGGEVWPRPPELPIDNFDNIHNPQEHTVSGSGNNIPRSAVGITVTGDDNVVGEGASNIVIVGSENVIFGGLSNVTLIHCDGLEITESDALYINNCQVTECPDPSTFSSGRSGSAELDAAGTVNVSAPEMTSSGIVMVTSQDNLVGKLYVTPHAGSFDISSSIAETGTVTYFIVKY